MNKFKDIRHEEIFSQFSKSEQVLVQFFLLLRLLQQSNQFVYKNPATGLTILESSMLLEIDARQAADAESLCKLFNIEQSTFSRNLARIRDKKLVVVKPSTNDARKQHLFISPKARELLKKHDMLSDKIVSTYLSRISSAESEKILSLFKSVCDDFSITPGIARKGEHPIRTQMRRLGYLLGLTRNENFMGSHLTMLGWQTLSEIYTQGEIHSIKNFAQKFNIPAPNLTQQISSLEKMELITKIRSDGDKREIHFTYTKKGLDELILIINTAQQSFMKKLSTATKTQIVKNIPTLEKMISKTTLGNYIIDREVSLSMCRSSKRLSQARAFIVLKLIEKNQLSSLPFEIASPFNRVVCVLKHDEIIGVIELTADSKIVVLTEALSSQVSVSKASLYDHLSKFLQIY